LPKEKVLSNMAPINRRFFLHQFLPVRVFHSSEKAALSTNNQNLAFGKFL